MHNSPGTWLRHITSKRKLFIGGSIISLCGLLLIFVLWHVLLPTRSQIVAPNSPKIHVTMGFGNLYRTDRWTPVHITINNPGPDFRGQIEINANIDPSYSGVGSVLSPWSYTKTVMLASHSEQEITIAAPYQSDTIMTHGFTATLRNDHNQVITSQVSPVPNVEIKADDLLIGFLAPQEMVTVITQQLSKAGLPNQNNLTNVVRLNAQSFPDTTNILANFDVLIIDTFSSDTLNSAQINALRSWVNQGGTLIEVGGSNWQQTIGTLPSDLTPVRINGTDILPNQITLLPPQVARARNDFYTSLPDPGPMPQASIYSTATLYQQESFSTIETLAATAGNTPLVVKAQQGAGNIAYLALNPAEQSLASWSGTSNLWQMILLETLGERLLISDTAETYDSGPGQLLARAGLLNQIAPDTPQGPWMLEFVLLAYLGALGPLSWLLLRKYKRPSFWRWRVALCWIIIFSVISYGLAYYQKKASVSDNTITIAQLSQNDSLVHATTYMGLFMPNPGDFHLQMAGNSSVEPITRQFQQKNSNVSSRDDTPMSIKTDSKSTDLMIHNQGLWNLNPLVMQQDQQLDGTLKAFVSLHSNRLVGTITNTLHTAVNDIYILFPHNFVAVGNVPAGQTINVDAPLHSSAPNAGKTLSDQIAEYNHLPDDYFPYANHQRPQTETQSHVALLSALSGTTHAYSPCGGVCLTHAITNHGTIYATGGQVPNPNLRTDYDPLLISGSPATLIGWAAAPLTPNNNVTINDTAIVGHQMTFVQMPVSPALEGHINLPTDYITSSISNFWSADAETLLPGVYSLSNGYVVFDLAAPDSLQVHMNSLTISVPDLIAHPGGPGSGAANTANTINTQLYNWRTASWETITLTQDAFTIAASEGHLQDYLGVTQRLLIKITSSNNSQVYFGKPSLNIDGFAHG